MSLVKAGKPLDKKYVNAFSAITTFITDLWEVFGTKQTSPLALYRRLTEHITFSNTEGIMKAVSGFQTFFKSHEALLVSNKLNELPVGTVINYHDGKLAFIEIQKFLHKSDEGTKNVIREHLLTIRALLDPSTDKIAELTAATNAAKLNDMAQGTGEMNISTDTKEGQFVNDIMQRTRETMSNVSNLDNPMMAMMELIKSGVVNDMVSGLQQGVGSGDMDINRLFTTMQKAIGSIMPATENTPAAPTVEEIKDVPPKS